MNRQWTSLAKAVNAISIRLPSEAIKQFAEKLLQGAGLSDLSINHRAVELWSLDFRQACQDFLSTWKNDFPDLPAMALVGALLSSAHIRSMQQQDARIELVWTGPDVPASTMRQTEQAILELIDEAKERLLIVSFAIYRIPRIRSALVSAAARGVRITLIVETPDRVEGEGEYDTLRALGDHVIASCRIYYWPRKNRHPDMSGRVGSLHIKCIVQDGKTVFLSSANLTEYAFTTNMELGTLIRSRSVSSQIEKHVASLMEMGILEHLVGKETTL